MAPAPSPTSPANQAGFTLIEMMAVTAIIGLLAAFAMPKLHQVVEQARTAKAIGDIRAVQIDLMSFEVQNQPLPADLSGIGRAGMLDPWGNPYVYNPFPTGGGPGVPPGARRDRFLVPVNSTFDLYSMGPDGRSVPPLSGPGADDIVRANDGGFIGSAWKF